MINELRIQFAQWLINGALQPITQIELKLTHFKPTDISDNARLIATIPNDVDEADLVRIRDELQAFFSRSHVAVIREGLVSFQVITDEAEATK